MKLVTKFFVILIFPLRVLAGVTSISADQFRSIINRYYGVKDLKQVNPSNPFANSNGHGGGNGVIDVRKDGKIWGYSKDGTIVELDGVFFEHSQRIEDN